MSAVWYADNIPNFKEEVLKYIENYNSPKHDNKLSAPHSDAKSDIEKISVQRVWEYYEDLGFSVESVEEKNLGWDLAAKHKNGTEYLIEVKGLSGSDINIQLTPNEYAQLKKQHKKYILAVCANALKTPSLHIFSILKDEEKNIFLAYDDNGNLLEFTEITSAVAKPKE